MKIKNLNNIQSGTLLFFLINSFFINFSLNSLTTIANNDSIIDIIIGSVITIFLLLILLFIRKKYNCDLIKIISSFKILSYPIFIILIIISSISIIYTLNNLTSFINYYILKDTNYFTISLTLIITIIYLTSKKMNTITKISEITFYIYIFGFILGYIGLVKYINLDNLKPLFTNSINNHIKTSFYFFSYNILPIFLILNFKKEKDDDSTLKIFTILSMILILLQTILIISVLGINLTNIYIYPDIMIYKKISFLNILERVEVFLSFNQLLNGLFMIIVNFSLIITIINKVIKKEKELILLTLLGILFLILTNTLIINKNIFIFINISLSIIVLIFLIKIIIYKYILHLEDLS